MTFHPEQEQELHRREQELLSREQALRLREIEAELYQQTQSPDKIQEAPFYQTQKNNPTENIFQRWSRKAIQVGKFLIFVVVSIAIIKVSFWLSLAMIVGLIGFIGYKIFLDQDSSKQ